MEKTLPTPEELQAGRERHAKEQRKEALDKFMNEAFKGVTLPEDTFGQALYEAVKNAFLGGYDHGYTNGVDDAF